jgi:hypothetical protein
MRIWGRASADRLRIFFLVLSRGVLRCRYVEVGSSFGEKNPKKTHQKEVIFGAMYTAEGCVDLQRVSLNRVYISRSMPKTRGSSLIQYSYRFWEFTDSL